jgi:hypothetical protein
VHLVVGDVACLAEIHGIDDLVESIWLITIEISCLTTMAWIYMSANRVLLAPSQAGN